MHNRMKLYRSRLFLLPALLVVVLAFAGVAVGAEIPAGVEQKEVVITKKINMFSGKTTTGPLNPEDEVIDQMVGIITVKKPKRKKGQRQADSLLYRFNGKTIVRTARGKKVTMNDLLVPCKAKVYFYPNKRKAPVLYGISMTGRYKNSRLRWNTEDKIE